MNISLVAAKSENGVIGNGNEIPWRAKGEQKLFKEITMGGVLIMGRKTYDSIGKPLPGRETIVISRGTKNYPDPIKICSTLSLALESAAQLKKPIFVIGGGEVYSQAISLAIQSTLLRYIVAQRAMFSSGNTKSYEAQEAVPLRIKY